MDQENINFSIKNNLKNGKKYINILKSNKNINLIFLN